MEIEELRQLAKSKGIKYWHKKKPENLINEMLAKNLADRSELVPWTDIFEQAPTSEAEVKAPKKPKIEISITEIDSKFFKSIGFKAEWLASIANQYDFNRFHYVAKFKAFRCYRDNKHCDWISVNDLGLINEKRELTEILLKHQPLQKDKRVIKLPWR